MSFLNKIFLVLICIFTCNLHAEEQQENDDEAFALELAQKSKDIATGFKDQEADIHVILSQREQTLSRKVHIVQRIFEGVSKSIIRFEEPLDLKNTKLLTHSFLDGSDMQWVYLPKVKRAKRIESGQKEGRFMGSEFTYEDLRSQEINRFSYEYLGKQSYQDETCYLLKRIPRLDTTMYSHQTVYIDQVYRMQKIEYYGKDGNLLKILDFNKFEYLENKYWRPMEMIMENSQNGNVTRLYWDNFHFDENLDEMIFEKSFLEHS
jgi:hypothetical protein